MAISKPAPRILIVGNYTCGNRGDAAIMRGLITELQRNRPDAELAITSRYPTSSEYILGRPMLKDVFTGSDVVADGRYKTARRRAVPWTLMAASGNLSPWLKPMLSDGVKKRIRFLSEFDLIVQLGGSNFVDLYGYAHFETAFAALAANRPVCLMGHSIGPISRGRYCWFVNHLLNKAAFVGLRETMSEELLRSAGMPMHNVSLGADTAWNVPALPDDSINIKARYFEGSERPIVALTARDLAPFHKDLKTTQAAYEQSFALLAQRLIDKGYNVLAAATCTGIDSYHRDDRMVALRIGQQVNRNAHFKVCMDELNDIELGAMLSRCVLVIATRLHSAIIAMNFGTPALAIGYEHKTQGTLVDMGLGELFVPMSSLLENRVGSIACEVLDDIDTWRQKITIPVSEAKQRSRQMIREGLSRSGFAPAPEPTV